MRSEWMFLKCKWCDVIRGNACGMDVLEIQMRMWWYFHKFILITFKSCPDDIGQRFTVLFLFAKSQTASVCRSSFTNVLFAWWKRVKNQNQKKSGREWERSNRNGIWKRNLWSWVSTSFHTHKQVADDLWQRGWCRVERGRSLFTV